MLAYVIAGTLAAAAGIALATTTTGGDAVGGDVFTLTSIAAVVVGGVSLFGGRGSAVGAICGAFVLTLLVNVLFFANIDPLLPAVLPRPVPRARRRREHARWPACWPEEETMSATTERRSGPSALKLALTRTAGGSSTASSRRSPLFVIGEIIKPGFASIDGIQEVLQVASFVGLVAAGQTFVILIGGIDLSVPWVLNTRGHRARDGSGQRVATARRCRRRHPRARARRCVVGPGQRRRASPCSACPRWS